MTNEEFQDKNEEMLDSVRTEETAAADELEAAAAEQAAGSMTQEPDGAKAQEVSGGTEEADMPEANEDGASQEDGKKKTGIFKKKEKKDKRDEQIEALTDQLLRSRAEFDNYRKRTEKEMDVKFDLGAKNVVEKILPIVDNFERGLASVPETEKDSAFAEGMDKIYRQLTKTLEDMGVCAIEAVGQPFDPAFHNAVMQVPAEEGVEENTVVEEFQKGYSYKGFVVRYSMVKVAT